MKYVSVLTPPLLVCAVFLIAVVAFLRHEMRSGRSRSEDLPSEDTSDQEPIPGTEADTLAEEARASRRPEHN